MSFQDITVITTIGKKNIFVCLLYFNNCRLWSYCTENTSGENCDHISGQFLDTPKQSPDSEIPPPLTQNEEKDTKEVKERVSAKDRWAKGKAILKGGERESQKSQYSAASGGSSGSAGPQTSAVTLPNMVPRFERIKNQQKLKP